MPKIRKSTSKRVTLKKKYSIQKKIKDSKKKMKKEAKKLKGMGIVPKSKRTFPHIPQSSRRAWASLTSTLTRRSCSTSWSAKRTWTRSLRSSSWLASKQTPRCPEAPWSTTLSRYRQRWSNSKRKRSSEALQKRSFVKLSSWWTRTLVL